ncbi:Dopey, N-terminal-domain-containing protein [Dichotomocladium elegans]|nr:Dopey, N-terminal-domain-containing protein [Dichotomocladium elegans]
MVDKIGTPEQQRPKSSQMSISQRLFKKISMRSLSEHSEASEASDASRKAPLPSDMTGSGDSLSLSTDSSKLEQTTNKEQAYQSDPRFRKYVQLIEKNLNSFDAVNEWADIISFLGRLLKSFQAYPQFPVIPRKHTVAKRLAQCLNPGFPAGVHQKTLDVYAYILETIGSDSLAEDLALWSLGLFPFVQYAAMQVKPQLLSIFEKYYFPLKRRLRPAMRGFIIALLPALDEEGSEFFDKVVVLMDHLAETIDLPFFHGCMWRTMISNPGLRPPALNYLLRRLPKITGQEDVAVVLGSSENISLMIRAFAATLGDAQLLVQRGMLELLVQDFMIKHRVIPHDDLVILMKSALSIVLRKDMSLNRRLYAWLLGDQGNSQANILYFNTYGEKAATQAVRSMLFASADSGGQRQLEHDAFVAEAQKPYKILISLLDKWEIGQPIVQNIFVDSLVSLQKHVRQRLYCAEILQTANMWMEMVEPYHIWTKLFELFDTSFPGKTNAQGIKRELDLDNLKLLEFTLKSYKFTDDEIRHMHLPLVLVGIVQKIQESVRHPSFIEILPLVDECVQLIHIILRSIPENTFWDRRTSNTNNSDSSAPDKLREFHTGMDGLAYVREFYCIRKTHQRSVSTNTIVGKQNGLHADRDHEATEDEGDLSTTAPSSNTGQQYSVTRPQFGPIRGTELIKELTKQLTQILVELVNSYIVPPDVQDAGVDVGVDGKRLRSIGCQLERILQGVCSALTFVSTYTDDEFTWDSSEQSQLIRALLMCCQEGREFGIVDAGLSTFTQLVKKPNFLNGAEIKRLSVLKRIMNSLWVFLSPTTPLLHMRTVELIWLLTEASLPHQIETIITDYLISKDDDERLVNYEKFGVIWELSEDKPETANYFSRPMFLILDLLNEKASPVDRRVCETWIRTHLRSYVRLLDPFVTTMLSNAIIRRPTEKVVAYEHQTLYEDQSNNVVIPYYLYMRPFDMSTIDYLFTHLISLTRFGALGFLKACKGHNVDPSAPIVSLIESSLHISLSENDDAAKFTSSLSFLELLVQIAIRYLDTEPCEKYRQTMIRPVRSIQLHAAEFLYQAISKMDSIDMKLTKCVQEKALLKLLFCISTGDLELQQKLLHLVHSTMAITAAATFVHKNSSTEKHNQRKSSIDSITSETMMPYATDAVPRVAIPTNSGTGAAQAAEAIALASSTSALFVKCVLDAFTLSSNRSMIQHWMDFVLASLPHLRGGFRHMVLPILVATCDQIVLCNTTVRLLIHGEPLSHLKGADQCTGQKDIDEGRYQEQRVLSGGPEQDILVFLNGLEKVLMFCMTERHLNDDWYPDKESRPLLPIPLLPENSTLKALAQLVHKESGVVKPRDTALYYLPVMLHILLDVWRVFRLPEWEDETSNALGVAKKHAVLQSFSYAANHVKIRLNHIFERLYKYCSVDYIEGFTEIFFMENPIALEYEATRDQYDLVTIEVLAATPSGSSQHIVSTLLEGIRQRTPGMHAHRRRHIQRVGKLTDTSVLRFAEIFCASLIKVDTLAHLWPIIHTFAKEYLSQAQTYKTIFPGLMRFLTVAVDAVMQSSVTDDRKTRRDAQDLYQRCLDYCILISGRSFDQGLWIRRSNVYEDDDSINTPTDNMSLSDTMSDINRNLSASNVSDLEKKASWKSREDVMIAQVNTYLATTVIPKLRQLIGDQDRINSLLNNLIYYVIGPALRTRSTFNKITVILDQICEMTHMPFTYKTWRKEVWDVYLDNRFFYMSPATAKKWKVIIQTIFTLEKERFMELVGRITTSPSTAFFTNKDQEMLNRGLNLRRLAYVIFCGSRDQYVPQLPVIQEKIVELLKLEHGEMVHVEIYLFLRIMLVRFSQKHLLNFWPVLITELMRLFNAFLNNTVSDRPEEAQIALAGCKFLDLLCALEMDAFQIYQWIFIRDTVEMMLRGTKEGPMSMMDLFSEKLDEQDEMVVGMDPVEFSGSSIPSTGQLKRPMLTMRSIGSIQQLAFFVDHVALYAYQSSFTLAKPDMPFIESLLQTDLLEGDIESD